jgi:hypothetical protein
MRRFLLCALLAAVALGPLAAAAPQPRPLRFSEVQKDTATFMGYSRTITLTAAQEAVKRAALEAVPAPCCSDNTAYTCCCPCNLAKTIWGLSNYLIARQGYDAAQTRAKVEEWVRFVNPGGYPGNGCYKGACGRAFAKAGCGGMSEPVVF